MSAVEDGLIEASSMQRAALRLCVGCRHMTPNGDLSVDLALCERSTVVNLVTGVKRMSQCASERAWHGLCGPQGKRWEAVT